MKIDRWEEYQEFFQLIILRYLVAWFTLVPIVAALVGQLPNPLPITLSGVTYTINLALPFHWQILWVSSLFFVIALGIYKVRCPKFIKKYNNYSDYSGYKHHPRWLAWEAHNLLKIASDKEKKILSERLSDKGYLEKLKEELSEELCLKPKVEDKQTTIEFKVDGASYKFGMPILSTSEDQESEKDIFYELFGRYSASRCIARATIKIFLLFSLILFIIVLGQHIFSGAVLSWKWFVGMAQV